jgi:hypothetical protein
MLDGATKGQQVILDALRFPPHTIELFKQLVEDVVKGRVDQEAPVGLGT